MQPPDIMLRSVWPRRDILVILLSAHSGLPVFCVPLDTIPPVLDPEQKILNPLWTLRDLFSLQVHVMSAIHADRRGGHERAPTIRTFNERHSFLPLARHELTAGAAVPVAHLFG